jgi:rhomboid protease GluP
MSEHEAESASPSAVPFTMTARKGRLSAAVQAAQLITMAIPLAGYLSQGGPGAGGIVAALLALIPVLILQVRAVFRPGTVALSDQQVLINAHTRMVTQRENIQHLFFKDGAGIVFHDVELVDQDGKNLSDKRQKYFRSGMTGALQRTGAHISIPGFSTGEVERLRELLGMAAPEPGSEVYVLEQYHHSLMKRTPVVWVAPLLIALNVGMFAVVIAASGSLLSITAPALLAWGADFGPLTLNGEWWRLLTCTFLHSGVMHLLCNMWGLHEGGRVMERLAGNFGFLVLYLFSGIAGSLLSIRWSPDAVCAGASGAVFGIYGALGAWHFRRRLDIPERIVREVRRSTLPFLGFNLLIGLGVSGIDQAAHLGGLLAGIVSGLILAGTRATDLQAGRQLRLLGLSILATCVIVAGALRLPGLDEIPGLAGELQRAGAMEERVLATYQSAARRFESGRMTSEDFVTLVRREILPEWNQSLEQLRSASSGQPENPTIVQFLRYFQLRAEALDLFARAVESDNGELMSQGKEKWKEATRIAKQFSQSQP